jgi:hypothetical protein
MKLFTCGTVFLQAPIAARKRNGERERRVRAGAGIGGDGEHDTRIL